MFDFINSGIIFGTNNVHFVDNDGTNILEIAITIKDNNNKIINVIVGLIKKIAKPHHPDEST